MSASAEDRGRADGGARGLPVLEQHHRAAPGAGRRADESRQVRRDGPREVAPLAVLAVVDVLGVVRADPLRPALVDQGAVSSLLDRREPRVADEDVAHSMAAVHERVGEIDHARRETAYERVAVGTFEGHENDVEHGRARIMARAR